MKIAELREWATTTFGAHSHREGQVLAAMGPLEEWLQHLAKFGIELELVPLARSAAGEAAQSEAPQVDTFAVEVPEASTATLDPSTFVSPDSPKEEPSDDA